MATSYRLDYSASNCLYSAAVNICCPPCSSAGEKVLAQFGHPFRSLVLRIRLAVLLKRDCLGLLLVQVRFDLITMGQVV